jgi:hypothetical protein
VLAHRKPSAAVANSGWVTNAHEIVNLIRMDIQLAVWRHRQQFDH